MGILGRIASLVALVMTTSIFAQQPLISGILVGDSMLAGHSPLDGGPRIWRAEVDLHSRDVPDPVRYGPSQTCGREGCFKATLHTDLIWAVTPGSRTFTIIPLDDLQYFEHNDFVRKLREIRFGKEKARTFNLEYLQMVHSVLFGNWGEQLTGVKRNIIDPMTGIPTNAADENYKFVMKHRYDIVPVDANTIDVFHLGSDGIGITRVARDARKQFMLAPLKVRNAVRTNNTFEVPFRGDFHAYDSGGAYYFLTDKGQLYRAKSKGKEPKDGWEVSTVWDDKNRPLLGVMHDAKAGKYYAFGTSNKKDATKTDTGERFYFELAAKPTLVEYKRTSKAPKPVLEGFHEAYACAREMSVRAAKK